VRFADHYLYLSIRTTTGVLAIASNEIGKMSIGPEDSQLSLFKQDVESFNLFVHSVLTEMKPADKPSIFDGTPMEFLLSLGPKAAGKFGEMLVRRLALDLGMRVIRKQADGDMNINWHEVEVKFARQKENGGFNINQIRPNQTYEYVVLVIARPVMWNLFTIEKDVMVKMCQGQHGGSEATETMMKVWHSPRALLQDLAPYSGIQHFKRCVRKENR
jgi:hypothetical protein